MRLRKQVKGSDACGNRLGGAGEEPAVWIQKDSEEQADLSRSCAHSWDHMARKHFLEAAPAV